MPKIVNKTADRVVIHCESHSDFVSGVLVWDEFQGLLAGCGSRSDRPSSKQDMEDVKAYLASLPEDGFQDQQDSYDEM